MRLGLVLELARGSTGGQTLKRLQKFPLDPVSNTSDHGYTVDQAPKGPLKKHLNQIQPMQAGQMSLDDGVNWGELEWILTVYFLAEKKIKAKTMVFM